MAIALVKAGTVATGTTSLTPAFGQSTTAGNLLICRAAGYGSTSNEAITISGTGWTLATSGWGTGSDMSSVIFYRANCGTGETAPTLSLSSGAFLAADLTEWSGAATTNPLDQTSAGNLSNGLDIYNSAADTNASDLCIYAVGGYASTANTITVTDSWKPTGGTKVAYQGYVSTSSQYHAWFSAYLLNGNGGSVADENAATKTGTITVYSRYGCTASFLPATSSAYTHGNFFLLFDI